MIVFRQTVGQYFCQCDPIFKGGERGSLGAVRVEEVLVDPLKNLRLIHLKILTVLSFKFIERVNIININKKYIQTQRFKDDRNDEM